MTHKNNIHLTLSRWRSTTRAGGGGSSTDSSGPTANSSDLFFRFDEPIKIKQSHTMKKQTTPGEGQARLHTYMKRRVRRVFLFVYLTLGGRNTLKQMVFWSPKTEHFFSKLWLTAQLTINTRNYSSVLHVYGHLVRLKCYFRQLFI